MNLGIATALAQHPCIEHLKTKPLQQGLQTALTSIEHTTEQTLSKAAPSADKERQQNPATDRPTAKPNTTF